MIMPNPTLLERVEAASGPDRELDAVLWLAFTPGATRRTLHVPHWQRPYDIDETRDEKGRLIIVPSYTSSLDAALALVERVLPGWLWMVASADPPNRLPARVELWTGDEEVRASAATPALALLAALLKATPERSDV